VKINELLEDHHYGYDYQINRHGGKDWVQLSDEELFDMTTDNAEGDGCEEFDYNNDTMEVTCDDIKHMLYVINSYNEVIKDFDS
jgi:hypothetical protein